MTITAERTVRLVTAALHAAVLLKMMVRSLDFCATRVLLACTNATPAKLPKNTVAGSSFALYANLVMIPAADVWLNVCCSTLAAWTLPPLAVPSPCACKQVCLKVDANSQTA